MNPEFRTALDAALASAATPGRAPAMRAYMRSQFEFIGVGTPQRRLAINPLLKQLKGIGQDNLLKYQALSHDNMWVRRIALLHQLGWRGKVDAERLFHYSLSLAHEKEFFIQKAIGWALRDYARHDPDAVRAFTLKEKHRLSALSYREATKHLSTP